MPHVSPFEVVMGPAELYIAPVGTAFPKVDEEPTAPWVKVGTNGKRNYTEDGVTVALQKTTATFMGLGAMAPIKAVNTTVGIQVNVGVADISPELLSLILNQNQVTAVPAGADAGYELISGYIDPSVTTVALLVRGPSPLAATGYGQFEIVKAYESSESSELRYVKSGEATTASLQFTAMEDIEAVSDADRIYRFRAMSAPAST